MSSSQESGPKKGYEPLGLHTFLGTPAPKRESGLKQSMKYE